MTHDISEPSKIPPPPAIEYSRRLRRSSLAPEIDLTHSGMSIPRYVSMHALSVVFPITAGLLFFGWRAGGAIILLCGSAGLFAMAWRRIGLRGWRLRMDHVLWLALLLALMLPAQLFSTIDTVSHSRWAPWPLLVAAGGALVIFVWILGGAGQGRIHPVLIAHLLLVVTFQDMISPRYTLTRDHAFTGDELNAQMPIHANPFNATAAPVRPTLVEPVEQSRPAWIISDLGRDAYESIRSFPAAERLETFTTGHEAPERSWISLESLVRDRLPPLEDVIVGGQPSPIGQSSAIAIIIGGLFLLYRGLIDYRVPLLIFLSAFICFLVFPVPVVITETARISSWFPMHDSSVGTALGVTFANYELMASPLLFMGFFLATAPSVRPLVRRARTLYAIMVGVASAAFQIYVSVAIGPYLALLGISLLAPSLDRLFRPRAVV